MRFFTYFVFDKGHLAIIFTLALHVHVAIYMNVALTRIWYTDNSNSFVQLFAFAPNLCVTRLRIYINNNKYSLNDCETWLKLYMRIVFSQHNNHLIKA